MKDRARDLSRLSLLFYSHSTSPAFTVGLPPPTNTTLLYNPSASVCQKPPTVFINWLRRKQAALAYCKDKSQQLRTFSTEPYQGFCENALEVDTKLEDSKREDGRQGHTCEAGVKEKSCGFVIFQ